MPITFETERCRVRPFEETDVAAFMAYRNNLDWMQFQGFKGKSYLEYKAVLLRKPKFQNGVQLAVVSRETGELLGDLYLKLEQNACWIGYTIAPPFARQGLAAEVVTELLMQLKREGLALAKAGVEAQNAASIALLKKLGFAQIGVDGIELIFQREL
ncbi:MAG TPA: GNAT family protein [Clostridia bacterium]|nr:GNAT family protein [Clostridia bacterium]